MRNIVEMGSAFISILAIHIIVEVLLFEGCEILIFPKYSENLTKCPNVSEIYQNAYGIC